MVVRFQCEVLMLRETKKQFVRENRGTNGALSSWWMLYTNKYISGAIGLTILAAVIKTITSGIQC
jgi:hypothetical protein